MITVATINQFLETSTDVFEVSYLVFEESGSLGPSDQIRGHSKGALVHLDRISAPPSVKI